MKKGKGIIDYIMNHLYDLEALKWDKVNFQKVFYMEH